MWKQIYIYIFTLHRNTKMCAHRRLLRRWKYTQFTRTYKILSPSYSSPTTKLEEENVLVKYQCIYLLWDVWTLYQVHRVRSTNPDTGTNAVKTQGTFRLCKYQQNFMSRVCLHWRQVTFGSGYHCQNYETLCFLSTFP